MQMQATRGEGDTLLTLTRWMRDSSIGSAKTRRPGIATPRWNMRVLAAKQSPMSSLLARAILALKLTDDQVFERTAEEKRRRQKDVAARESPS